MNRLHLSVLVGLGAFGLLVPATGTGQAVSVDATSLMRRLDSIEARMRTMEAKGGARPMAAAVGSDSSNYSINDLDQRMGQIEREVSQQAGTNDRLSHAIEQLAKRFDDYTKDADLRLSDLEAKMAKMQAAPTPVAAAPVVSAPAVVAPAATPAAVAAGTAVAAAPVAETPALAAATGSPTTKVPVPEKISAADLYNKAYAYLTATDYDNARVWLDAFLKRYPGDKLADNAWYWLGEVQLVQNNPSGAVVSFRNGLKYFPKGAKAPANLYKMGVALEQLKQPELARGAWEKLMRDYPKSPEAARGKEKMLGLKPAA